MMRGVVVTCCNAAVTRPAASPAAAALRISVLSMPASVAGQAEGVARVVRGVVQRHRAGEAGAEDDEEPEGERQYGRPSSRSAGGDDGGRSDIHETSLPSLRRRVRVPARAGLLARGSPPCPRLPVSGGLMRVGSPLTVAGAAADSEARLGSFLTAFPFHPQARLRAGGEPERRDYAESRRASQAPSGLVFRA